MFGAVVFSALMAGEISAFGPDVGKAVTSAGRIMNLIEKKPLIDTSPDVGRKLVGISIDLFEIYSTTIDVTAISGQLKMA